MLETVIANCVSVGRSGVCSKVKCQSKVIVPSNRLRLIDNINSLFITIEHFKAGPIAERSKSVDIDCGPGDPGSNPGNGMCFFWDGELSGRHIACFHMW